MCHIIYLVCDRFAATYLPYFHSGDSSTLQVIIGNLSAIAVIPLILYDFAMFLSQQFYLRYLREIFLST